MTARFFDWLWDVNDYLMLACVAWALTR